MSRLVSATNHLERAMGFELHRLPVHRQGPLTGLEDLQYPQRIGAIGFGRTPGLDTVEKMLAFQDQWLTGRNGDGLRCWLFDHELAIYEIDLFIEQLQLICLPHVVENRHSILSYYHQLLLLMRVQPADEQVCPDAAVEQ